MVASSTLYANYAAKGMICKTEWQIHLAIEVCACVSKDVAVRHFAVAVIVRNFDF